MRLLDYLIILTTSTMMMSSTTYADNATKRDHAPVVFQVIQDQMNIDASMIKSASIIDNNGTYGGLKIVLKPAAAKELKRITKAGVGRAANLELNNKTVTTVTLRSRLKHQLVINDITQEDAQAFIDSLKKG